MGMPRIKKKEYVAKPLRLEAEIAKDVELLSKVTEHSQNDILNKAIKSYLYENRQHFVGDMAEDECIARIEHSVVLMHEDFHETYGGISLDICMDKSSGESGIFEAKIEIKNRQGDVVFEDTQMVDFLGKDWSKYKKFLYKTIVTYADVESSDIEEYFKRRFGY